MTRTPTCPLCLEFNHGGQPHRQCIVALLGRSAELTFEQTSEQALRLAAQVRGEISVQGQQDKLSVQLTLQDKLEPVRHGGTHILKLSSSRLPNAAENEHVTMQLARHLGFDVPACGLLTLADGERAFLIRRFDTNKSQDRFETFGWVLREHHMVFKCDAEHFAYAIREHFTDAGHALTELFRRLVFSWWVANADFHAENISMRFPIHSSSAQQRWDQARWSPLYDLSCTALWPEKATRPVVEVGRLRSQAPYEYRRAQFANWCKFAEACGLQENARDTLIAGIVGRMDVAKKVIGASALPEQLQATYLQTLQARQASFLPAE